MKNLKNKAYWFLTFCYVISMLMLCSGIMVWSTLPTSKLNEFIGIILVPTSFSFAMITPIILKGMFSDTLLATQKEIDDLRSILYHKEVELQQKEAKLNLIETFLKSAVS